MEVVIMANFVKPYYSVEYVDDNKRTHITVARNTAELDFIKDRFERVRYELVVPAAAAVDTIKNLLEIYKNL